MRKTKLSQPIDGQHLLPVQVKPCPFCGKDAACYALTMIHPDGRFVRISCNGMPPEGDLDAILDHHADCCVTMETHVHASVIPGVTDLLSTEWLARCPSVVVMVQKWNRRALEPDLQYLQRKIDHGCAGFSCGVCDVTGA